MGVAHVNTLAWAQAGCYRMCRYEQDVLRVQDVLTPAQRHFIAWCYGIVNVSLKTDSALITDQFGSAYAVSPEPMSSSITLFSVKSELSCNTNMRHYSDICAISVVGSASRRV